MPFGSGNGNASYWLQMWTVTGIRGLGCDIFAVIKRILIKLPRPDIVQNAHKTGLPAEAWSTIALLDPDGVEWERGFPLITLGD